MAFSTSESYQQFQQKQDFWGFGQIIAPGLLLFPLANFFGMSTSTKIFTTWTAHNFHPGVMFSPKPPSSSPSIDIMDSKWTIFGSPYFHHTERCNQPLTLTRAQIYANKWYPKILWLLYFFSLWFIGILIDAFSVQYAVKLLLDGGRVLQIVVCFMLWGASVVCILWLNAIVCMDEDVYRLWNELRISRWRVGKTFKALLLIGFYFSSFMASSIGFILLFVLDLSAFAAITPWIRLRSLVREAVITPLFPINSISDHRKNWNLIQSFSKILLLVLRFVISTFQSCRNHHPPFYTFPRWSTQSLVQKQNLQKNKKSHISLSFFLLLGLLHCSTYSVVIAKTFKDYFTILRELNTPINDTGRPGIH